MAKANDGSKVERYTDVKDRAKLLRAELKRAGWGRKQVSVRISRYSMGESISVSIKDPQVPLAQVEEITRGYESVGRCSHTGEILNGGNTYVSSSYAHGALDSLAAMFDGLIAPGFRFGPFEVVGDPQSNSGRLSLIKRNDEGHGSHVCDIWTDSSGPHTMARMVAHSGLLSGEEAA